MNSATSCSQRAEAGSEQRSAQSVSYNWYDGRLECTGCGSHSGQHHSPECPLVNAFTAGRIPQARSISLATSSTPFIAPQSPFARQARYQDAKGEDWIDEFARTATADEFRGAMRFTIGKYNRRAGKKDALLSEIRKMRDYCQRWEEYEMRLEGKQ